MRKRIRWSKEDIQQLPWEGRNTKKRPNGFLAHEKILAMNFQDGSQWLKGKIIREIGNAIFLVRTNRRIWRRQADQLRAIRKPGEAKEEDKFDERSPNQNKKPIQSKEG
jgi:hypothetical protein